MSAFYQAGYISNYKRFPKTWIHNANIGYQSCKRIIGYFWSCSGYPADQSRFPCIWKTNNTNICQKFKLKKKIQFHPVFSRLTEPRSSVCGCSKKLIPFSSTASSRHYKDFVFSREIVNKLICIGIKNQSPGGHFQNNVITVASASLPAFPGLAIFRIYFSVVSVSV
eukprot:gnl/Chilomastix_cuspidata/9372.p2 GENE.gnl/Chilomastix_cuspidata/9372~~gnl/Chilomastix_cuspidata/9372.p2  ORF type:complete len:167 (+),score=4.97 gnl/Chilomastix_cuspidata/9372:633-1133(+)